MPVLTNQEIARQWAKGLAGEFGLLGALTAQTMRVWHSHDGMWLDSEQSNARGAERDPNLPRPVFHDVRLHATERGFILQAWIADFLPTLAGRIHIIHVVTVEDGEITAVEEYVAPEMGTVDGGPWGSSVAALPPTTN